MTTPMLWLTIDGLTALLVIGGVTLDAAHTCRHPGRHIHRDPR